MRPVIRLLYSPPQLTENVDIGSRHTVIRISVLFLPKLDWRMAYTCDHGQAS